MKFLTSGKVKDVYELENDILLFKFSNRVSAYDVKFKDEIPKKGEILCKFAEYWFNKLDKPNHFVERRSDTEIVVKKINMLPIECVVRGYFYGSLVSRWKDGKISLENDFKTDLAAKLQIQFLILQLNQHMMYQLVRRNLFHKNLLLAMNMIGYRRNQFKFMKQCLGLRIILVLF